MQTSRSLLVTAQKARKPIRFAFVVTALAVALLAPSMVWAWLLVGLLGIALILIRVGEYRAPISPDRKAHFFG